MDLITGGAGFIGSHLVERLLGLGRPVRVLDNLSATPTDPDTRKTRTLKRWRYAPVEFIEGDIRDPAACAHALRGVKRVFHLAALPGSRESRLDPKSTLEVNVLGTQTLLGAMELADRKRLILVSSGSVYGDCGTRAITEDDPLRPAHPYAASKVAAEALAQAWQQATGGSLAIVRPFTVYGPRQRPGQAVMRFLCAAQRRSGLPVFGDGSSSRHYLYVSDLVELLLRAATIKSTQSPAVFNAAGPEWLTLNELVERLQICTGIQSRVELMPADAWQVRRTWASMHHTHKQLEYVPRVSIDKGLKKTWIWLRDADE